MNAWSRGVRRRIDAGWLTRALLLVFATFALVATSQADRRPPQAATASMELGGEDDDGLDLGGPPPSNRPTVEAAFGMESYRPGEAARLTFFSSSPRVTLRIVHAGTETQRVRGNDNMAGDAVTNARRLGAVRAGHTLRLRIGNWPSGLYFARLEGRGGQVGYAPFVLRPRRLGEHRIAVVLPTLTWQAYNLRDDNGDGKPDTWYGNWTTDKARLARPFENRGTPRHYRSYDEPFLRWLVATGREVDYLADRDLRFVGSGAVLAREYDLLIFPGHHEYVTTHEYDVVTAFRNRGGNLLFLSANNFFCRVDITRNVMTRVARWRDVGRPEAALVGVQYVDWNHGRYNSRPYIVQAPDSLTWLFEGVGVSKGERLAWGGIEIDRRTAASPRGISVVATIPNVFGPGRTAEMTYYETPAGAKVFAAGAFTLAGEVWHPQVRPMIENLWERLGRP